jgi:hypothetical protein
VIVVAAGMGLIGSVGERGCEDVAMTMVRLYFEEMTKQRAMPVLPASPRLLFIEPVSH